MRKPGDQAMEKERSVNKSKSKLRKGLWSPEEDDKLMNYMLRNGQGCWSDIARNAGLQRWSQIAARLPGRTDNEIKNFWNSTIKKRLKNTSSLSSSSSNNSSTDLSEPTDHVHVMGGIMYMQEHDTHGMIPPNFFNPFPNFLDDSYDLMAAAAGLFTGPDFMSQVGIGGGFCGDYGIEETDVMGFESELSFPPLMESRGIVGKSGGTEFTDHYTFDEKMCKNQYNIDITEGIKVEDMIGFDENHFQGQDPSKMGEWDLEGLWENISSFPYLDFQVE
ncbi:hypothetical protein U1Q18_023321 [Sarracenia purpurea var. burkii]